MKCWRWKLEVLTPLHIGSGNLLKAFDYVYDERAKLLRVIDLEKLLAQPRVDPADLARYYEHRSFQAAQYLRDRGIPPQSVERYHLACPRDPGDGPLRAFIKTPWNKPYLPGSSLKGVLRTAVLWRILHEDRTAFDKALAYLERAVRQDPSLPQDKRWTGLNIERLQEALGPDPHRDILRVVHVEDSVELPLEALRVYEVSSYLPNPQGQLVRDQHLTTWVEALAPGTVLQVHISWDEFLFSEMAHELGFQRKGHLVEDELDKTLQAFTKALIEAETAFYRNYRLGEVADRLQALKSEEEILLCLGWGGGWSAKTVTRTFAGRIDLMALRRLYRLGQSRSRRNYYDPVFPKSRRLCESSPGILMPLGWVRLRKEA